MAARRNIQLWVRGETVQQGQHVDTAPPPGHGEAGHGPHVPMQELLMIHMGDRPYLIRLHDVAEIVRPVALTPVPMAPSHLLGLANIHGQIVCIIDPCQVLHLQGSRQALGARTRFIMLRHARMHVGIWVDNVASISRVPTADLPELAEADEDVATLGAVALPDGGCDLLNARALFR